MWLVPGSRMTASFQKRSNGNRLQHFVSERERSNDRQSPIAACCTVGKSHNITNQTSQRLPYFTLQPVPKTLTTDNRSPTRPIGPIRTHPSRDIHMAQRAISLISSITLAGGGIGGFDHPSRKPPEYADKNTMVFECAEVRDMRVSGIAGPLKAFVECRRSTATGGVLCFIQNPVSGSAAALYRCAAE